ncbi:ABC transporter ATP-binding protein [Amorphus sp. 3PC139-8]|uniref:ABC transporter ATP-binding protein n=1 Tax=Amorphus sp. 3PC139-8 TaxID=2735676 RepID=UPI00345DA7CF
MSYSAGVSPSAPRIVVRNLTKRYGSAHGEVLALDDVSLEVAVGEKLVLLGPSGCGKTTLLRSVAGLETPDEGEIEIDGKLVFSAAKGVLVPPEKRGLTMVFQSYALWPHMTVFDNVAYPLVNTRVAKAEIRERVREALRIVGCAPYEARYPSQLSGGQQQRVSLARAIVGRDKTVLFDEPLSNVDAQVREQLRGELVSLQRRFGFSALYVTHDQSEALALAHRIAVMKSGRVMQIGTARDIYDRPTSRYVTNFTGAANSFDGRVRAVADGVASLETAFGVLDAPAGELAVGQAVDLVIRPEHLRISTSRPEGNAFEIRIDAAMFLGIYTEYAATHTAASDEKTAMLVRSTEPTPLSEGDRVWATVSPTNVVVFPKGGDDE